MILQFIHFFVILNWKMFLDQDPKPPKSFIFSCKRFKPFHPPLSLGNTEIKRVIEHKHLGLIIDSKLSFTNI